MLGYMGTKGSYIPLDLDMLAAQSRYFSLGAPLDDWWDKIAKRAGMGEIPACHLPRAPLRSLCVCSGV